ncbi:MAG: DUF6580 family putative transport protein [Ferruginibacter sp.]
MKQNTSLLLIAIAIILAAAISRVAFYPITYSPVIAMALFGGAVIKDKKWAFALPLFAMFLSDFLFEVSGIAAGFWGWGQLVGYGILGMITIVGFAIKKINVQVVAGFSILSTLLFFFLSNSSVWLLDTSLTYTRSFSGWMSCLAAGIPFLKNDLLTNVVYSGVLFGGYVLLKKYVLKNVIA